MTDYRTRPPTLVIEYRDPLESFLGWLVIDDMVHRLSAGGMRVQPGLTREHMVRMARNMTLKMRLCGLPIDGAKCGIAYDPTHPGKREAIRRFMLAIRPYLRDSYSMGPDLNTDMEELDSIAASIGVPSVKMAIARAQDVPLDIFLPRYGVLQQEALPGWKLGALRAGYGVAAAVLAVLEFLRIHPTRATVAMQGFGSLARATAATLLREGVGFAAVADAVRTLSGGDAGRPLDMVPLLASPGTLLPDAAASTPPRQPDKDAVLATPCDVLVLAAIENAVTRENVHLIQAKALVPGANLAVSEEAEHLLHDRGILVLPSFMAGCGGSLSMEGLFGPSESPTPAEVLHSIRAAMQDMTRCVIARSQRDSITPTEAALLFCNEETPRPESKPYGSSRRCCNPQALSL